GDDSPGTCRGGGVAVAARLSKNGRIMGADEINGEEPKGATSCSPVGRRPG
ncbi:MAG: hypothetical protein ACJAZN_003047, partial [Planctomycetota bacterium]